VRGSFGLGILMLVSALSLVILHLGAFTGVLRTPVSIWTAAGRTRSSGRSWSCSSRSRTDHLS